MSPKFKNNSQILHALKLLLIYNCSCSWTLLTGLRLHWNHFPSAQRIPFWFFCSIHVWWQLLILSYPRITYIHSHPQPPFSDKDLTRHWYFRHGRNSIVCALWCLWLHVFAPNTLWMESYCLWCLWWKASNNFIIVPLIAICLFTLAAFKFYLYGWFSIVLWCPRHSLILFNKFRKIWSLLIHSVCIRLN